MFTAIGSDKAFDPSRFKNEEELQDLIEQNPSVLNSISELNQQEAPLLIIGREYSVQSGRMDFLAVDIDANLYVVETKLASNQELRRKVIGQVMEYASNIKDMPHETFTAQCSKYLKTEYSEAISTFYRDAAGGEGDVPSSSDYASRLKANKEKGQLNVVVIANKVSLDIQRLFNYMDQATSDDLNFLVLEINKYEIDSKAFLYSNVVWAAKYIKSLYTENVRTETEYMESKTEHVREIVIQLDKWCQEKGLNKTLTRKGMSWKGNGGSIYVDGVSIRTNWALDADPDRHREYREEVVKEAADIGFGRWGGQWGGIFADLNDSLTWESTEQFLELAYSVIEKAGEDVAD